MQSILWGLFIQRGMFEVLNKTIQKDKVAFIVVVIG
jgi:hypothetical protein